MVSFNKGQGEIFGLALMFVLLIFGIVIYAQFKALNPDFSEDSLTATKYKILSENTISSLKKISTPCSVQTGKNTLSDLMRYCMEFSSSFQHDPLLFCDIDTDGIDEQVAACEYSFSLLNQSIQTLFSSRVGLGSIPFSLHMYEDATEHIVWHNRIITNINESSRGFTDDYDSNPRYPIMVSSQNISSISLNKSSPKYYLRNGFNRVNAGKDELSSGRKSIEFELNIYYR